MSEAAEPERLNRFLARRGVASRRGADHLIAAGRVRVNGGLVSVGVVVDARRDEVTVDGDVVAFRAPVVTFILNKPRGVVTSVGDPHGRPTVMDLAPDVAALVPVGRLDADSRGLLILSTDGELVHRLTHPRHAVVKTYRVSVRGFTQERIDRLAAGVDLDDGPAQPVRVEIVDLRAGTLDIAMGEGRKREVRRMCAACDLDVLDLQRTSFGPLRLGRLAEGECRGLRSAEIAALYAAVALELPG